MMRKTIAIGFTMLGLASIAFADDLSPVAQADAAYAKREDVPQAKIAMITYERAAGDPKVAGEAYWKAARSAWWLGEHAQAHAEKLALFQAGMDDAKKAIALNPDSAEAHFWLGANEGSYGDTKGVMKSLSMVKPIRHEMAEVIRIDDHYSNGGAYRVLGVVDYKVPGLMGGSKKRAQEELEKARALGPNDPFTYYYWAEFYKITGDDIKKNAELATLNSLQVAPDTIPELKMLQAKAARELK